MESLAGPNQGSEAEQARRKTQWTRCTMDETGKQNKMLSLLSTRRLRPLNYTKKPTPVPQLKSAKNDHIDACTLRVGMLPLKVRLDKICRPAAKVSDSFSSGGNSQNSIQITENRKKGRSIRVVVAPARQKTPISASNERSIQKSPPRGRGRTKTYCKVIIEKNKIFPFLDYTKKAVATHTSANNAHQAQLFTCQESEIKKLQSSKKQLFMSNESLFKLPLL